MGGTSLSNFPVKLLPGMLVINKPPGISSKDVSRRINKIFGRQQSGHVGTLDPAAEGVLPILFGNATRLQDYLLASDKIYEFDVQFGKETDTLDAEGVIIKHDNFIIKSCNEVKLVCESLVGSRDQEVPRFSAVKYKGKALYEYARKGAFELVPQSIMTRNVIIKSLVPLRIDCDTNAATFVTRCSSGTYVRSLAKEIASGLGTCAFVTRLVRIETCSVTIAEAYNLDQIEVDQNEINKIIIPIEKMKMGLPKLIIDRVVQKEQLLRGQSILIEEKLSHNILDSKEVLICESSGRCIGIGILELNEDHLFLFQKLRMRRQLL